MSALFPSPTIRVLTLWQPWASLVFATDAAGDFIKRHETRGWPMPLGSTGTTIAIHSAKSFPAWRHIGDELGDLCLEVFGCQYHQSLPFGCILGTVEIGLCQHTQDVAPAADDRIAGDWTPGRYATRLHDPLPLAAPVPAKGKQGWWSVDRAAIAQTPAERLTR